MTRSGRARIGRTSGGGRIGGAHGVTGQRVLASRAAKAKVDGAPGRHEPSAEALCSEHVTCHAEFAASC